MFLGCSRNNRSFTGFNSNNWIMFFLSSFFAITQLYHENEKLKSHKGLIQQSLCIMLQNLYVQNVFSNTIFFLLILHV